jgi:hypothetical protein
MSEAIEIRGKLFVFNKLNVFDQQYVLGKMSSAVSALVDTLAETGSEQKAFFKFQQGLSDMGRDTFKEVSTMLMSKVKYRCKVSDNVSNIDSDIVNKAGAFQYDWVENDLMLFQELIITAFKVNFESFLDTPSN